MIEARYEKAQARLASGLFASGLNDKGLPQCARISASFLDLVSSGTRNNS